MRIDLLTFTLANVILAFVASAQETQLVVNIVDEQGQLLPARAWVDADRRRLFQPVEPDTVTPYPQDQSFSCDGTFTVNVPAGQVVVHIEKGKEYLPVELEVEVPEGQTIRREIQLKRWIHMVAEGWYSADLHVHLGFDNSRVLRQLALADDVNLIPSFTYWLRGQGEIWQSDWPDESYRSPILVDATHLITRNNIEIERIARSAGSAASVGATFLFNLQQPITAENYGEHFPTDADLCSVARTHSPAAVFDSDKPSWAETVVGAALGQLDTIQVCHNHYNRSRTLPGGWGMIGPLAPGESNWSTGDGLFHRTNSLYYRLLNCGFRLGVSGGSAIGVMPAPTGFSRVYAQVDGALSAEKMWASIKSGRTFATTGPMLWLSANGLGMGETLHLSSEDKSMVQVKTRVQSIEALESLEIVHCGHIVAAADLRDTAPNPQVNGMLELGFSVERSGWIAARALYRAPDGLLRQAHTSPIYILVDGQPSRSPEDALYMLRWVDRLIASAEGHAAWFPSPDERSSVMSTYQQARQVFANLASFAPSPR